MVDVVLKLRQLLGDSWRRTWAWPVIAAAVALSALPIARAVLDLEPMPAFLFVVLPAVAVATALWVYLRRPPQVGAPAHTGALSLVVAIYADDTEEERLLTEDLLREIRIRLQHAGLSEGRQFRVLPRYFSRQLDGTVEATSATRHKF